MFVNPSLNILSIPMADGGEGTCDLLTERSGGSKIKLLVRDPLSRSIEAEYGISHDGKIAFIEMAKASGLQWLKSGEKNPMKTSTYGTGQFIADALDRGVIKIILGIGGSATTDGGIGMAEALGFVFLDQEGRKIPTVGKNLIQLHSIEKDKRHARLDQVEFVAIYDVKNPLYGKEGAAYIFGPQKGANPQEVKQLDEGLKHFANIIQQQFNADINFPGAGAGGGLSGGAKFFLNAHFSPGINFILQFTNLEKHVQEADLVITGEGKIDEQTFSGKVVEGVAGLAANYKKECIAFTGKLDLPPGRVMDLGIHRVIALSDGITPDQVAIDQAFLVLRQKTIDYFKTWGLNR